MLFKNYSKTEKILIAGIVVVATAIVVSLVYSAQLIIKEPDVTKVMPDTTVVNTPEEAQEITQQERTDFLKKLEEMENSDTQEDISTQQERDIFINKLNTNDIDVAQETALTQQERDNFLEKLDSY